MRLKFLTLYLITIFAVFGLIPIQKADATPTDSILVSMVPPNPNPNANVTITLKSYAYNLDSAQISWSIAGKVIISEIGKKSFSTTAPAAGGEINVVATLYLPDGPIEKNILIQPSVMILLWQAMDSYVPPFYKGKALPTADSEVRVTAMPEIRTGSLLSDPKNMIYSWKKDYTNNVDGSGYGKNSFSYVGDYLDDSNNVSVIASTIDQKFSSEENIYIGISTPKILFYKNDNKLGTIWEQTLLNEHKIEGSEVVQVVPYFISPKQLLNPLLVWDWFINDERVNLASFRKNLMPLQAQSGVSGRSKLKLEITNKYKIFQTANNEIEISF